MHRPRARGPVSSAPLPTWHPSFGTHGAGSRRSPAVLGAGCVALICLILMVCRAWGAIFDIATGAINDVVAWLCAAAAFLDHGACLQARRLRAGDAGAREARPRPCAAVLELAGSLGIATRGDRLPRPGGPARFTYESWQFNDSGARPVAIPIWIPQMSFALGSLLLVLAVARRMRHRAARRRRPTFVRVVAERHAGRLFPTFEEARIMDILTIGGVLLLLMLLLLLGAASGLR
jgi:hypothetical protein